MNRRQDDVLAYLLEESRVLREHIGNRRLGLTNRQRRRLVAKGKRLGRRLLSRVATIVTPDTILRWHRPRKPVSAESQTSLDGENYGPMVHRQSTRIVPLVSGVPS